MKKVKGKKIIIIAIIVVVIVFIIGIIAAFIHSVSKQEAGNKNNYENSYQYKMEKQKDMEILKGFYGDYIVTSVSGTSPSIQLPEDQLKDLKNDIIGSQIIISQDKFALKYNATKSVNGVNYSNANISNPNYEVNETNNSMFEYVYKTTLQKAGVNSDTAAFINVGVNNNYEQEIIKNNDGTLVMYSQGVFFKLEPAAKILAQRNAQLEQLANDALKTATGTTYKYIFPVQQILKDGKFEYKKVDNSDLFMCSNKNDSVVADKDTMFITLTKGVVKPVDTSTTDTSKTDAKNPKDAKDNKNPKDTTANNNNKDTSKTEKVDKNAGKPFYDFTIQSFALMNQTVSGHPIIGKVYLDGSVEVTKE